MNHASILPIGNEPALLDYSRAILDGLRTHEVRAEIDESTDKINGKIQRRANESLHHVRHRQTRSGSRLTEAASVRVHGKGNLGAKPRGEAIAEILQSIRERRA
jgi:threonyl-tRNA synthetase